MGIVLDKSNLGHNTAIFFKNNTNDPFSEVYFYWKIDFHPFFDVFFFNVKKDQS